MRLILAHVGLVVLCVAGTPALDERAAWREACKVSGYSCFGISPPLIARAPLPHGLLGRYRMGDKYLLVNEGLDAILTYAVMTHELTHFLQWKHGNWKFTKASSCENEREAFVVSNTVLRRLGDEKHTVNWDEMRAVYGCPL